MIKMRGVGGMTGIFFLFVGSLGASGGGTTAASFLNLGVGARGLAMGEAYTAESRGVESLFWNPAGLAGKDKTTALFSYNPLVQKTNFSQAAFSFPLKRVVVGAGYSGVSYQSIDSFDEAGNKLGEYDARDQLGILGLGFGGDRFKFGMDVKWVNSTIDGLSADAFAGDAGVLFTNPLLRPLKHALVAGNMGGKMKFLEEEESLPLKFVFGNGLALGRRLDISFDIAWLKGRGGIYSGGLEWRPFGSDPRAFSLRSGYTTKRNEIDKLSGLSVGTGFNLGGLNFDYAWIPYGELGDSHSFTIYWQFNGEKPLKPAAPASTPEKKVGTNGQGKYLIILNDGESMEADLLEEREDRFIVRCQGRKEQIFKKDILKSKKIEQPATHQ